MKSRYETGMDIRRAVVRHQREQRDGTMVIVAACIAAMAAILVYTILIGA